MAGMDGTSKAYAHILFPDASSQTDSLYEPQTAALDITPDCIKVISTDGNLLTLNRAGRAAFNIPDDSELGMPWLALLPESVRALGTAALQTAAHGRTARFPGQSIQPDGTMRYWDNLLTPVVNTAGEVLSILCVSRDITATTLLEKQLEDAIDREKLLAREMRHRIKNLFSVVSGLISLAQKEATSASSPRTVSAILQEKLGALSRASDAVFFDGDADLADIAGVITAVLQPYGNRCNAIGDTALIRRDAITTFALFLHEFATNSVKYGALSKESGNVTVRWMTGKTLELTWTETGGPAIALAPGRHGFGTEMVDRVIRSAGGTITRSWRREGLVVDLQFPRSIQDANCKPTDQ
jgi:two-component sensor histidine kinase